ncbi:MAG TPA: hypothetical protein VE960_07005 [bacterium]|nr:hypothetical protein [bacterium]
MRPVILVTVIALILAVSTGTAEVPQVISYQGVLRDASGVLVADGVYSVTFVIYDAETGGTMLWAQPQTVAVEDGIFNALLGSITPLTTLTFEIPYWLSVSVEGEPVLLPRTPLTSAPYALHADSVEPDVVSSVDGVTNDEGNIDLVAGANISIIPNDGANTITISATAGGGDDGDWIIYGDDVYRASGNVGVGTASPTHRIGVHSAGSLVASAQFINDVTGSGYADGLVMGVDGLGIPYVMSYEATPGLMLGAGGTEFVRIQPTGIQISNNTSIYGNLSVWGFDMDTGAANGYVLTADASGNGTWQAPAATPDSDWTISGPDIYRASGKVGIGTASPLEELHVNGDVFVPYSGSYSVGSTSYTALSWDAGIGGVAVGNSITPLEFFAGSTEPIVTMDTDGTVGVGTVSPLTRLHVQTDTGDALFGQCSHTSSLDYVGVTGQSVPTDYYGIGGEFTGGFVGVNGQVSPAGGYSYYGGYFSVTGGSGTNTGAYAYTSGPGTNYSLYGYNSGGGDYAGYFYGNVYASGTMTSGSARTRIDHPLDPTNMYLNHNAVESQEMKTIYDGTVVLSADGSAWVEMPEWFDALNSELRYQLTCVGGHAPVYVAEEVRDNRFRIAGGTAGLKVCWQVTGVRKDAFAAAHSAPVEEMKPADERGFYVHPMARGLGEEMSPDYRRHEEVERKLAASR